MGRGSWHAARLAHRAEAQLDAELRDGAPDNPFRPSVPRWAAASGRERQGVWIGELKRRWPDPPAEGVIVRYG